MSPELLSHALPQPHLNWVEKPQFLKSFLGPKYLQDTIGGVSQAPLTT